MSNVQRMWAGSLHTVEPDRLLNGIYVREQVVFAKDYDALSASAATLTLALRALNDVAADFKGYVPPDHLCRILRDAGFEPHAVVAFHASIRGASDTTGAGQ